MFKELKVIKLIVFVGMFILIISNIDFSDNIIDELYTDKVAYNTNDSIRIYSSTKSMFSLSRTITVSNVAGETVSEISIPLTEQVVNENPVENGMGFGSNCTLTLKTSGLYFIENKYPIVVKSNKTADITVVYPYANNILYYAFGNDNAYSRAIKKASLNRTAPIDVYSHGLLPFFEFLNNTYSVNYMTDMDLEDYEGFKDSKAIVLYGKLTCSTPKMNANLKRYLNNNGNILLMSSYALNNVCWYNNKTNNITMHNDTSETMLSWRSYNQHPPEKLIGVSYPNGGYSPDSIYNLADKEHFILKNIKKDYITVKANLYNSPPIKWMNELPHINIDTINFFKGSIIAYGTSSYNQPNRGIKGIFILQPDSTSGKILSLGTEDWCLPKNYQENSSIQQITKNSVNYLLK